MPNRDYAVRSRNQHRGGSKGLILIIVVLLLALAGLGLWVLKATSPVKSESAPVKTPVTKNTLPTPPEEVYSYIRDLENREVPIDKNSKVARLTKEQEQLLQQQKEEEQRKRAQFEQQQAQNAQAEGQPNMSAVEVKASETVVAKAQDDKAKAEPKKAQETVKKEGEAKAVEARKVEEKPTQTAAKEPVKPKANEPVKTGGKFGLQCGAFKNKAQAENMQARLVMAGFNARINSSGEWNRVVVGPVGERAAASQAQANARSVAECLIVGM